MCKTKVINTLLIFLALSLAPLYGDSQAQEPAQQKSDALHSGAWALQFRITDNLSLSSFQGEVISAKRHFSRKSAFRFAIGLGIRLEKSNKDYTSTVNDSIINTRSAGSVDKRGYVQLDLQFLRYANPESRVKLFWGTGPLVGFENNKLEQTHNGHSDSTRLHGWTLGLSGFLGAEFFVTKSISLHAEYSGDLVYTRTKTEMEYGGSMPSIQEQINKGVRLRANGILFGLSAYF